MEPSTRESAHGRWKPVTLAALLVLALAMAFLGALRLARADATSPGDARPAPADAPQAADDDAALATGESSADDGELALADRSERVDVAAAEPSAVAAPRAGAEPACGVRVVDATGRVRSDVEVALLRVDAERAQVLERARWSDARGAHELREVARRMREPSTGHLEIAVLLPRPDAPRERVWPELVELARADALELRLGPEASANVIVVERGAGRVDVDATLRIAPRGAVEPRAPAFEIALRGSSVRLDGLEPERELDVELRVAGRANARARLRPGEAGSCVECVVELGPPGPTLVFDVLDPAGAALGARALRATLLAAAAPSAGAPAARAQTSRLRGDSAGRVTWRLAPLADASERVLQLQCELPEGRASARVQLPRLDGAAALELAPIALVLDPLLASGRVRDERGVPIRDARVRVEAAAESGRDATAIEVRTRRDGRFELRGTLPAGALVLSASAVDHVSLRLEERVPPLLELELALQRTGALEGRVELPRDFPSEALALELHSDEHGVRRLRVAPDGSFSRRGLPAGRYDLEVLVGREWPCARVEDLAIEVAGVCRDERLAPLDLARKVALLGIEVVDADGMPVPAARARVFDRPADGAQGARQREFTVRDGWLEVPTSYAVVDAEFHAPGRASRRERALADGARVPLGGALRTRIELGAAVPALGQGRALWAAFTPTRPLEGELAEFSRVELERRCQDTRVRIGKGGRSGVVALPAAGRYELRLYLGPFRDARRSRLCLKRDVEIEARAAPQPIRLALSAARVASWVGAAAAPR